VSRAGGEQGGEQGEGGEQGPSRASPVMKPGEGQPGEQGEQPGEGKIKFKGKGRSSDPTDWIGDELAQHQTEAQQEGIVSTIAEPTFYNFN
jgi:hypothetical protein